ncbi:MAG: polysaccharide biosynthesis tyrosine autokinase [Flavobacteriaceae bacterium]
MQQTQNYISNPFDNEESSLNIRSEIEKYIRYWKWFALGVFIAIGIAYVYLRYTLPTYSATATILIKDNKKSGLSAELEAFKDLGIVGGGSVNNTDNEIEILRSRKVVGSVVDSLNLYIHYYISEGVKQSEVYKSSSPINISFVKRDSILEQKDTIFNVNVLNNSDFDLLNVDGELISSHKFGELITSSLGIFKVSKSRNNSSATNVLVSLSPKFHMIDSYRNKISISPVNKNSSVLVLNLQDATWEKAEDFLDELVKQYNLDAINDKNQVSKKTIEFINARLDTIGKQLAIIQDNVKEFKISKEFTGLPMEVQLALESLKETNGKIIESQTQSSLAKWIEGKLKNENTKYDVLPASLGFKDHQSIDLLIAKYNDLISQRNQVKVTAGDKNPVLVGVEKEIENSRSSLLRSLSNITKSIDFQLLELKKEESKMLSKVKSIPANERGYIDIARQQEIISALYQYLLRKKEETDISLAVTVPNAKIIDVAYSSKRPVSPKKKVIYLIALLLGLMIPFVIIYILDILDTKIHNKNDVESHLSVPFLGDVPKSESKEKVIIGNDIRSSTAEAFRLIRTNLDFMLASNRKQSKAIFVTSTTSGEGKSFISINIAATLALSGKKVLLMGMDLRAPKVTEYLGIPDRKGVTNYITDDNLTLDDIKFNIRNIKGLDIISSGVVPPNPAELLMTKRVENLFTIVKQEYDIVIVDTAPVNLVTDTLLIGKYADMFMYVVRANYLDKRLLAVPQELYNEKKLPNMAIVLNDTDPKRSYGYGYGGYGYGYVVVEKPWYKKIFNKG